jgi:hypothetical protein
VLIEDLVWLGISVLALQHLDQDLGRRLQYLYYHQTLHHHLLCFIMTRMPHLMPKSRLVRVSMSKRTLVLVIVPAHGPQHYHDTIQDRYLSSRHPFINIHLRPCHSTVNKLHLSHHLSNIQQRTRRHGIKPLSTLTQLPTHNHRTPTCTGLLLNLLRINIR